MNISEETKKSLSENNVGKHRTLTVALISENYNDFLNHEKCSIDNYTYISEINHTYGKGFSRIEFTKKAEILKTFKDIYKFCEYRLF